MLAAALCFTYLLQYMIPSILEVHPSTLSTAQGASVPLHHHSLALTCTCHTSILSVRLQAFAGFVAVIVSAGSKVWHSIFDISFAFFSTVLYTIPNDNLGRINESLASGSRAFRTSPEFRFLLPALIFVGTTRAYQCMYVLQASSSLSS